MPKVSGSRYATALLSCAKGDSTAVELPGISMSSRPEGGTAGREADADDDRRPSRPSPAAPAPPIAAPALAGSTGAPGLAGEGGAAGVELPEAAALLQAKDVRNHRRGGKDVRSYQATGLQLQVCAPQCFLKSITTSCRLEEQSFLHLEVTHPDGAKKTASPRSEIEMWPSWSIRMLAGFKSRCMMHCSCMYCRCEEVNITMPMVGGSHRDERGTSIMSIVIR